MLAPGREPSPRQLQQWVMDRLRNDILEGRLRAGEWLRQERLAQEYGVSHMPVREALKQLAAEGLVEHVPYRGVRVQQFTVEDVEDLYSCRAYIEGQAARHATVHISDQDIREMRVLHQRMARCVTPDTLAEYRELNRRFHAILYAACDRPFLTRILGQIWNAFPRMLWNSFAQVAASSVPGRDVADTAEHEAILVALEARDPDAVEKAMRQHISAAGHELVAALRGSGEQST